MEKDIIDIVREKEYFELNSVELAQIADVCSSEEEFIQMKSVFVQMDSVVIENPTPKAATKASLDDLFAATYPKATPIWYAGILAKIAPKEKPIYRQPLMQLAAVALLLLLVVPMFNSNLVEPNQRLAKAEVTDEVESMSDLEMTKDEEVKTEGVILSDETEQVVLMPLQEQERVILAEDIIEEVVSEETVSLMASAAPTSTHPDGIFMGSDREEVSNSISAVESTDLLDLLTTTF